MLHQPLLSTQLTIWIYFKFLSFKFTEVNLLYIRAIASALWHLTMFIYQWPNKVQ